MKLEQVTNLDDKNLTTSEKFDDDVVSTNYDIIIIFPIYGQFGAICKPDSRIQGSRVQNRWVAPRSTQPFILPRSIK